MIPHALCAITQQNEMSLNHMQNFDLCFGNKSVKLRQSFLINYHLKQFKERKGYLDYLFIALFTYDVEVDFYLV